MRKTLFEKQKGKSMEAHGEWEASKNERFWIEGFGYLFFFGVFAFFILLVLHAGIFTYIALGVGIFGMIGMTASLIITVVHKNKQEPMEKHYYDVDYTYNGITNEVKDNTKEITQEEFYNKKKEME